MNPLRSFFLQLSRLPPALMLIFIVGIAVLITFAVSKAAMTGVEGSIYYVSFPYGITEKTMMAKNLIEYGEQVEFDDITTGQHWKLHPPVSVKRIK